MTRTLEVFKQIPLTVSPFGYLRMAQCDDSGDMFFAAAAPPRSGVTYLSISNDGQKQTVYEIPKYVADNAYNSTFSVSSDGKLQLLFVVSGQPVKWLTFGRDGKLNRETTLSLPSDIDVRSFAVTSQGYLLLVGYQPPTDTHAKGEGRTYSAIFNYKGDVVAKLIPEDAGRQSNGQFTSPEEPAVAEGENFFWIDNSGKYLVVTDTDGSTVRRLRIPEARPGDQIIGLSISNNLAVLTFMNGKATPRLSFLMLDTISGTRVGLFLPPTEVHGNLTCFDSSRGFTFLSNSSGHLSIVQSAMP